MSSPEVLHLLLLEDDEVDADVIRRFIHSGSPGYACELTVVKSLQEAAEAASTRHFDVALVDLHVVDARGMEILDGLAEADPDIAVVAQTGDDDWGTIEAVLERGAQDYLVKSELTPDALRRTIRYAYARQRAALELREVNERVRASNHDLDEFAHVVAHDLRAPIRTARLLADRLIAVVRGDAGVATQAISEVEFAELLDDSLERVDRMIRSILDYASLRESPDFVVVDVKSAVDLAADAVRGDLEAAECVGITCDVPDRLCVTAHHQLLDRVLQNLFTNSIRYRSKVRPLELDVVGTQVDSNVRLTVTDNGSGVTPEDRERVFQLLERAHSGRNEGLGFGLAICRRIINGFGGSIYMDPDAVVGTSMVIELPVAHPQNADFLPDLTDLVEEESADQGPPWLKGVDIDIRTADDRGPGMGSGRIA